MHYGSAVHLRGAGTIHCPLLFSDYRQIADTVQNRVTKGVQNYFKYQFGAKKSLHLLEKSTRNSHFSLLLD